MTEAEIDAAAERIVDALDDAWSNLTLDQGMPQVVFDAVKKQAIEELRKAAASARERIYRGTIVRDEGE